MATIKKYGFVIDVSRCIDCRACLVACSVENKVPNDYTRIWVQDLQVQGEFPDLTHTFVPYNCMHCDHPPCTEVCVSRATYKDSQTGLVLVDQDACIGCGYCVEACPYRARHLDKQRGVVDKCNGCLQRISIGQQPACVATCVGGSRLFGDLNDPESDVSQALKNASSIMRLNYEANGVDTDPNIYYINAQGVENPLILQDEVLPKPPGYTLSEQGWKKVLVPVMAATVGAAFLVQAVYFTKQLIEGEKEFEE
jgi:tetrathionate reductase subunit B